MGIWDLLGATWGLLGCELMACAAQLLLSADGSRMCYVALLHWLHSVSKPGDCIQTTLVSLLVCAFMCSDGVILSGQQPGRYEGVTTCDFNASTCTCVVPPVTTTLGSHGLNKTFTTEFGPDYIVNLVSLPVDETLVAVGA